MDENKIRMRLLPKGDFEAIHNCGNAKCGIQFFKSKSIKNHLEISKNDKPEIILVL
jgi:hypothetical protein